jgi:hypothetical protein
LRSTFAPSKLVRLLDERAQVQVEPAGMDFAERLGLWLNAFDAIRLQSAHQALRASTAPASRPPAQAAALAQDVEKVRAVLARAIAQDADDDEADAGYGPWQRRHAGLQQKMELMIRPLREHVRQALAQAAPRLRQLAVLDASFDEILAAREQELLAAVPALAKRRFERLRAEAAPQDASWRRDFDKEWRELLLAELELRLQPVTGLVEALAQDSDLQA